MKKSIFMLFLILSFVLSGCQDQTPYVVDCDQYPTHADCIEEAPCDSGFILTDGTCEPEPLVCDSDQIEYDGTCVDAPLLCDEGFVVDNEECVFDNASLGDYLDIYYLNDFHGALEPDSDSLGISYIANLVNTRKEQSPDNVLFVAGGDMLQGSALSNYYDGLSTITLLNASQLDVFTVGNHEFDWGLDTVLVYADGDETNGEADFPFLGANIFQKSDNTIPDGIEPYTIIEQGTHKIGIIGTMGYGLEYSIAQTRIDPYYFGNPIDEIATYAEYLRVTEGCDTIIVAAHDSGSTLNTAVSALTGNQKVDAIFNGHSHQQYTTIINDIPVVQSGAYGRYVGHVRFRYNNGELNSFTAENLDKYDDPLLLQADPTVQGILEDYMVETDPLFNNPIILSESNYSSYDLSVWIAKLMRLSTGADIAFQNYGGTRNGIDQDEIITLATLYEIWPFDNVIKTVSLDGAVINNLLSNLAYDTDIDTFEPGTLYQVATNDYVFDKTTNPFLDGVDPINTGVLMRDLAEVELTAQADVYSGFNINNEIQTTYQTPDFLPILAIIKEDEPSSFLSTHIIK